MMKTPTEKSLWQEANIQGGAMLLYRVVMNVAVVAVAVVSAVALVFQNLVDGTGTPETWTEELMSTVTESAGIGYLIAVAVGLIAVLIWKKPRYFAQSCEGVGKMKLSVFFPAVCAMLCAQFCTQIFLILADALLQNHGVSLMEYLQSTNTGTDDMAMFFYIGIAAPVFEELLFRGVLMKSLQPYGKHFSILASSLMFALFHGNPIQIPFAFVMGVLLAVLAQNFHIGWSVLLHMFNNLFLGLLLPQWLGRLPYEWGDVIFWCILAAGAVGTLLYLLRHWQRLRSAVCNFQIYGWQLRNFFTSPCILILLFFCLLDTALVVVNILLSGIQSLS